MSLEIENVVELLLDAVEILFLLRLWAGHKKVVAVSEELSKPNDLLEDVKVIAVSKGDPKEPLMKPKVVDGEFEGWEF